MPAHASVSTSLSLINRLRSQDADAWERFVGLYLPIIYGWLRELGLKPADASDVSQSVFQTLSQRIALFDAKRATSGFRGWLWGVTRNAWRDHCRNAAQHPQATGGSSQLQRMNEIADAPMQPLSTTQSFRSSLAHRALQLLRKDFEPQTWSALWRVVIDKQPSPRVADSYAQAVTFGVFLARAQRNKLSDGTDRVAAELDATNSLSVT